MYNTVDVGFFSFLSYIPAYLQLLSSGISRYKFIMLKNADNFEVSAYSGFSAEEDYIYIYIH